MKSFFNIHFASGSNLHWNHQQYSLKRIQKLYFDDKRINNFRIYILKTNFVKLVVELMKSMVAKRYLIAFILPIFKPSLDYLK